MLYNISTPPHDQVFIFTTPNNSTLQSYAGGKMDFARWKFKPKSASSILQSLSCQFCQLQLTCSCVSSFLKVPGFVVLRLIQNPPRRFIKLKKQMSLARFRQRQACRSLTLRPINIKSTQTFCIGKRSWFPFLEITSLLDYSPVYKLQPTKSALILLTFIIGNNSLEPLLDSLLTQIQWIC